MKKLTVKRLKSLLHYDPSTGDFTWLVNRAGNAKAGTKAGHKKRTSHITIMVDGKAYFAHRLAWLYMKGEWSSCAIDHINQNSYDNRFLNLREASVEQNNCNIAKNKLNTSGYKGVYWKKSSSKWVAQIRKMKKHYHLGYYNNVHDAAQAYNYAAYRLHGEFASYNNRSEYEKNA